ncbi:hypothetical protein GCM10023322_33640 [Rugosimonospora acidiphila]|uniref:Uncharacterized protein n=2 Tax=Rugosimonospora acidiphila TaxID=556531 RepID=A0ABP9RT98_9ACTN
MEAEAPSDVVDLLLRLGQACNDAGLALLDAQAQLAHTVEPVWRSSGDLDRGDMLAWVTWERYAACRDHVERLTVVYSRAAAMYAVCAVESASRVAGGLAPRVPQPLPVLASDVLGLAQIQVPLLQVPEDAVAGRWRGHVPKENAGLVEDHEVLLAAMAAVKSPVAVFDEPDKVVERQTAYLLEAEFPSALHSYASGCVFAMALMCVPGD